MLFGYLNFYTWFLILKAYKDVWLDMQKYHLAYNN